VSWRFCGVGVIVVSSSGVKEVGRDTVPPEILNAYAMMVIKKVKRVETC